MTRAAVRPMCGGCRIWVSSTTQHRRSAFSLFGESDNLGTKCEDIIQVPAPKLDATDMQTAQLSWVILSER